MLYFAHISVTAYFFTIGTVNFSNLINRLSYTASNIRLDYLI